jgi:hypothetical protein
VINGEVVFNSHPSNNKTDNAQLYIDIESILKEFSMLDTKDCFDFNTSLLCWLFIHPTPPEVYNHIPIFDNYFGELEDTCIPLQPILSSMGRAVLEGMSVKNEEYFITNTDHVVFFNYQSGFRSCATRIFDLLGYKLDTGLTQWGVDVHRHGLTRDFFIKHLGLAWFPGLHISTSSTFLESDEQLIALHREIWLAHLKRKQHGRLSNTFGDLLAVIIIQFDHVSFSLENSFAFSNGFTKGGRDGGGSDRNKNKNKNKNKNWEKNITSEVVKNLQKELESSFPPVSGRAGAKVFMPNLSYLDKFIKDSAFPELHLQLIQTLLRLKDHDWGLTTLHGIFLATKVDLAGDDLLCLFSQGKNIFDSKLSVTAKNLKTIHTKGRLFYTLQQVVSRSYPVGANRTYSRSIYGLDTIVGRSDKLPLDGAGEFLMRTVDPVVRGKLTLLRLPNGCRALGYEETSEYDAFLKNITRESFNDLIVKETNAETFQHWFSRRMFWGASGGAPGARITWDNSGERLRLNKRGALIALKPHRIRELWAKAKNSGEDSVIQFSKETIKFESGKNRGILNTSVENYVSQAYIQDIFHENVRDDIWYSYGHSTAGRIANAIRRLSNLKVKNPLMWDYSDFNINHIYRNMALGYFNTGEVIINRLSVPKNSKLYTAITSDMRDALRYIIKARYNTYLQDDQLGILVRAVRSLQSGERATSDINTTQNDIAVRVMNATSINLFGHLLIDKVGDRAGDDAFLLANSLFSASLACALFNLTGEAGQVYKINLNCISTKGADSTLSGPGAGEFLRLAYDGAKNSISGYPLRAMMGWIHGEFFAEPIPDPPARMATLLEQKAKLSRRGWQVPDYIFTMLLDKYVHWSTLIRMSNGVSHPISVL